MDAGCGLARARSPVLGAWNAATDRMVEDENPVGAGYLLERLRSPDGGSNV